MVNPGTGKFPPPTKLNVNGATPPCVRIEAAYCKLVVAVGSAVLVMVRVGGGVTVMERGSKMGAAPPLSVRVNVKLETIGDWPASGAVGEPTIAPVVAFRLSPAGRLPLVTLNV